MSDCLGSPQGPLGKDEPSPAFDEFAYGVEVTGARHAVGIGAEHARTQVLKLVDRLHLRVIDAATGQTLRELTSDPTREPAARQTKARSQERSPDP